MPNVAAFLSYGVLTCFTPGPNNITAMTNAGQNGFVKGLRFCIGMFIGSILSMAMCAVFTSALYDALPTVEPILRYVGAGYIFWMAIVIVLDRPHKVKKRTFKINSIWTGLLLQFVNPKAILYGFTNFATFILPYYKSPLVIGGFVIFLSVMGLSAVLCWAMFGVVFQKVFETHRKLMNAIMAILLAYSAVTILF